MKLIVKPSSLQELVDLKKKHAEIANEIADIEGILMAQMVSRQQKTMSETDGGKKYSVTYVQARTTVINELSLRKAMGAANFDKYTTKKLDRRKLEAAMEEGKVDPVVVSMHAEEKLSRPFLKFSESVVDG